MATLFSDFLSKLGVRHTVDYSDKRFLSMPFQSMFGLSKLLGEYGISASGFRASDKSAISKLKPPFLADTPNGFAIVTNISGQTIDYLTQSRSESASLADFTKVWNGIVLLAKPGPNAEEPHYAKHHALELIDTAKAYALKVLVASMAIALIAYSGIWRHWTSLLIAAIDIAGVYVSYLLVQKSLSIKNAKADAVCSVLQEGGCDTIAKSDASSFLGIVKWSEVGLAYFSVSLLALLLFPWQSAPWLALCNALCLPYTIWSISYQKFVAKTWCTLCVTVQLALWALFFCYLFGGWWSLGDCNVWPLRWPFAMIVACYALALLVINAFDNWLSRMIHPINKTDDYDNSYSEGQSDPVR